MTVHSPAVELVERPADGRVVTRTRTVRLGDVDVRARLRLDATARYLQDIATDDAADARLGDAFSWVARRTMIEVHTAARLDEALELATFCSGTGRSWAERRTSIAGERGASIEAVSLWIRVDPATSRPTGLNDEFMAMYGPAAAGRRVSSRLRLPLPTDSAMAQPWPVRRVDLDPLRHMNNAAQWAIVEQSIDPESARGGVAEIEHIAPVAAEAQVDLLTDVDVGAQLSWLVVGGAVATAARWIPGS